MMFQPSQKDKNLTELLKKSEAHFSFDQNKIKDRLMQGLNNVPMHPVQRTFISLHVVRYAASFALILIFFSATFAFASNSQPGDILFPLNKFGENVVLNLPLSSEEKANVQERIVAKRLEYLQNIQNTPATTANLGDRRLQTIAESDETIQKAIDTITSNKERLKASGQTAMVAKLDVVLNRLDMLATEHEKNIIKIENSSDDEDFKQNVDKHLKQIKKAHRRARIELNLEIEND